MRVRCRCGRIASTGYPCRVCGSDAHTICGNQRCLAGFYPRWVRGDKEVECPNCHGTGRKKHTCDDVCKKLGFKTKMEMTR
jgi:hypothetical protein